MKGLIKGISKLTIAGLIFTNAAIAAEPEVSSKKADMPQALQQHQDSKASKKPLLVTKQIASSVNQAQYLKLKPQNSSTQSIFLAQEANSDTLRQDLRIAPLPLTNNEETVYTPTLGFGIPSAFGANWGNAYISASGATAGKARNGQIDGSITTGFGLGDSRNTIGLETSYNLGSIRNFGSNGTFDLKAHRVVYSQESNQVAIAAGWNAFAQYGNEGVRNSSVYGAVTSYSLLQPDDSFNKLPIALTLGVGGGDFRQGNASVGVFGGVGLQVHPQVGIGLAWSGVGLNAGVSYVPVPTIPLSIGLSGGDLTNNSVGGTVLVLNVSYGFNFLPK